MVLALAATGIVIVALLGEVMLPRVDETIQRFKARRRRVPQTADFDPGRERRAEARARLLLKSCVNDEEWAMYRDLGFIRVWGERVGRRGGETAADGSGDGAGGETDDGGEAGDVGEADDGGEARDVGAAEERGGGVRARRGWAGRWGDAPHGRGDDTPYAYLVYPHKPILAYVPQTGRLLSEHCVEFPDETRPYGSARLPDSDDVLAKWMALTGDERRLIRSANMHLPGRQIDPRQVRRDLWRLRQWERARARAGAPARDDGVRAP